MKLVDTYLKRLNEQDEALLIAGAAGAAALAILIGNAFRKCNRTCSHRLGQQKRVCVLRCRALSMTAAIRVLKEAKEKCKNDKCVNKINSKIKKIETKMQKIKDMIEYNTPLLNVKQVD